MRGGDLTPQGVDGHIALPTAPGLGLGIVPEEIAEHLSVRNVLDLPADDGWAFETRTRDEAPYAQMRLKRRGR